MNRFQKLKITILLYLLVLANTITFSQTKNKQYQGATWIRYNINVQLPKKFLLKTEVEERFFITKKVKQQQFLLRFSIDKQLPKNWNIGIGFSSWYVGNNDELKPTKLMIPELRPQFEISNKNKLSERFTISHRYRAEWRFIKKTNKEFTETINGYTNNFRFRYQLALDYAVYKKEEKEFHLILFDEILINAGKSIGKNIFDQNRIGFSARYNFNKKIGLELGYINLFQQKSNGNDFYNRQILRFTLYNNFVIKKKEKTVKQNN